MRKIATPRSLRKHAGDFTTAIPCPLPPKHLPPNPDQDKWATSGKSFLDLPREIRQKILLYTITDVDIMPWIDPNWSDIDDEENPSIMASFLLYQEVYKGNSRDDNYTELFESEPFHSMQYLKHICHEIKEDMKLVSGKWEQRMGEFGDAYTSSIETKDIWEYLGNNSTKWYAGDVGDYGYDEDEGDESDMNMYDTYVDGY